MKAASVFALVLAATPVMAQTQRDSGMIYLDKLDKTLDDWWNALDGACRGEPGGSLESNLACDQRLALDKILIKKGCVNIYPATHPGDTSYWKCKR
jgi:hypothetical protein